MSALDVQALRQRHRAAEVPLLSSDSAAPVVELAFKL